MPPRVRPGRMEREAQRASGERPTYGPDSPPPEHNPSPLAAFMAFEDDTIPQPGAFETAFSSAPEDFLTLNFESGSVLGEFSEELAFEWENKFSGDVLIPGHSSFGGGEFADLVTSSACAAVAVRVLTHEDVEEWSTQLDDLDIALPGPLAEFVQSRGSTIPSDGLALTMSHPSSFAASVLRTGEYIQRGDYTSAQTNFWLPVCPDDPRTVSILAHRLGNLLGPEGVSVPLSEVKRCVFSGTRAPWDNGTLSERVKSVSDALTLTNMARFFSDQARDPVGERVLRYLGLTWTRPNDLDLVVQNTMVRSIEILGRWKTLRAVLQKETDLSCVKVDFDGPGSPSQAIMRPPHAGGVIAFIPRGLEVQNLNLEMVFQSGTSFDFPRGLLEVTDRRTRYAMYCDLVGQFF